MTAARPEPKSNEIYKQLSPSLEAGRNLLDEDVLFKIMRDARDIPVQDQALSLEGLAWIVAGKYDKGISLCEEAIAIGPSSSANWVNYAAAVGYRGMNRLQKNILYRGIDTTDSPTILRHACNVALLWADYAALKDILKRIEKMQIVFPELERTKDMLTLLRENELEAINLSRLAELAIDVAESNNISLYASRIFPDEDGYFVYSFMIETEDENIIFDLNNILAKKIIKEGLYKLGSVAIFDPLEGDDSVSKSC